MYLAKQFLQLRTNWYSLETGLSEKKGEFQYFHQQKKFIYWSLFANSLWNKEVALNLAVERHLLARPSLATEMHKQKEKENTHRTIKNSTWTPNYNFSSANVESLRKLENDWLVLAGKKQAGCAQVCDGEMGKMLEFLIGENINASSEAKFKKQNM